MRRQTLIGFPYFVCLNWIEALDTAVWHWLKITSVVFNLWFVTFFLELRLPVSYFGDMSDKRFRLWLRICNMESYLCSEDTDLSLYFQLFQYSVNFILFDNICRFLQFEFSRMCILQSSFVFFQVLWTSYVSCFYFWVYMYVSHLTLAVEDVSFATYFDRSV